jgi:hypothetical protein
MKEVVYIIYSDDEMIRCRIQRSKSCGSMFKAKVQKKLSDFAGGNYTWIDISDYAAETESFEAAREFGFSSIRKLRGTTHRYRRRDLQGLTPIEKCEMILHMAGWYEGREEDITEFCEHARKNNITLTEPMKRFFKEFGGLKGHWWWFTMYCGRKSRYGLDFDLSAESAAYHSDGIEDISEFVKEKTLCVGIIGLDYPLTYAIGESGKIYVQYFDAYEVFDSLIESMELSIEADIAVGFGDMIFL